MDSRNTTSGRFTTGKGCQAMSHMSAFPEFFVRSRSVKCKHHPSLLHFPPILMKITPPNACAKARSVSESDAIQYVDRKLVCLVPLRCYYCPGTDIHKANLGHGLGCRRQVSIFTNPTLIELRQEIGQYDWLASPRSR
ncbi:hypothetical protein AVEN_36406-1 [Araneus ventricosus]|uniref:Uncharacterized protein n=1 Tax=Araneus ventricosus TaxID=182803 RepID=A0A4Y2XD78_ARAVE|nr:hypothetical protein AVEN_248224-1 [Araneus ventricosus]GBO46994.1 hypothetical protein AVEN_36406-1 [Araneus ventricosus]